MLDFQNLKNKKVTVMGLGLLGGGVETVRWLIKKGANILVTDLKKKSQLKESLNKLKDFSIKYVLGEHCKKDFCGADLVIKNPAVPKESEFLKIARQNNIPIESDLSIFFRLFKGKIIGIAGTKGKSTTTTLISEIFKKAKKKFIFGGNIGQSPLIYLDKNYHLAVLEISSWQLEDMIHLKKSPNIAIVTTIFPDHLDRHKNFKEYIKAEKIIFKFQSQKDILILNYDNQITREFAKEAKSKVFYFSQKNLSHKKGLFIKGKKIFFRDQKEKEILSLDEIKNKQNLGNTLAAILTACLSDVSPKIIKKVLKDFKGLPNRLELIRVAYRVKYYNDTTATIPEATINALFSFPAKKIILISGGADKKLNFKKFAQEVKKRCKAVILLPGTATKKIEKELLVIGYKLLVKVRNMKEAVSQASKIAKSGEIVLLSPGCASFGIFQNAYERAKEFIKAVKKL